MEIKRRFFNIIISALRGNIFHADLADLNLDNPLICRNISYADNADLNKSASSA